MTLVSCFRLLRRILPICFGVVLIAMSAACQSPSLDKLSGSTVLVVGSDAAYPPFERQIEEGFEGFDIDLMQAVAEAIGFEVQFHNMKFDALIPALQSGSIDAAISAITITEDRAQVIDFSQPYFKSGLAIAVQATNDNVSSLKDLKGKKIAVQIGTTGADVAATVETAEIILFETSPATMQALSEQQVDAVINDAPVTLDAIATGSINDIKVVGNLLTEEFYGIALPKNSSNLAEVNRGLEQIMTDGTYARIYQKWFGAEPPALPELNF